MPRALTALLLIASASSAAAQSLTGSVHRGDARVPVPGVVLLAESPRGDSVFARAISGARGQFAFPVIAAPFRVRALRIGYRPADLGTFTLAAGETRRVELVLPENPLVLRAMTTRASARCDVVGRAGEEVATLFEEARKVLLATQLRPPEGRPMALVAVSRRSTTVAGDVIDEPQYRVISGEAVRPMQAVPVEDIEARGYVVEQDGNTHFRAPDSRILLSDPFVAAHCLQLVEGKGDRAGWIGIGFKPVRIERPKVGITGTLWIERATYELQRLEFEYAGLPNNLVRAGLGGEVVFTKLADGSWIESRFEVRMPLVRMVTSVRTRVPTAVLGGIERSGGEVLSMRVADTLLFRGDSALERRLLAAIGATGGSVAGIAFGAVRGTLTDSLRPREPTALAGDTVVLRELGLRAVTDSFGVFDFKGLPAGRYTLMHHAPWFDSVALGPIANAVEVLAGEVVETALATPALATYQFLQCGEVLDTLDTVLHGEVSTGVGAPLSGAVVLARWTQWSIDGAQASRRSAERRATTGVSGAYTLCGVPRDAAFDLIANPSDSDSNGVRVRFEAPGGIRRRDFVLGGTTEIVRVRGVVYGIDGNPIRGATVVSLVNDRDAAVSRADGRFELSIRGRRSFQVRVRALGFAPRVFDVEPSAALVEVAPFVLEPVVAQLDTVNVTAADPFDWRSEFERRRTIGLGQFVTEAQLSALPRVTPAALSSLATRIRNNRGSIVLMRGNDICYPRWFVDGYDEGAEVQRIGERMVEKLSQSDITTILNRAKSIEVYPATQAPPKYNDFDGCGVIVVWTR